MTPRTAGRLLLALSGLVFVASSAVMAGRAAEFNRTSRIPRLKIVPVLAREFTAFGRPVTLTDVPGDPVAGRTGLRLAYGDRVETLTTQPPPIRALADLGGYHTWVAALKVGEVTRTAENQQKIEPGDVRWVVVNRETPDGYDPQTWGQVRRKDWRFEFFELMPDGTIARRLYRFPRSWMGERSLGQSTDPAAALLAKVPALEERSFEWQTALFAMPELQVPSYKFRDTAVEAMGWTLPAAGFSALGIVAGLGLAMKPRR